MAKRKKKSLGESLRAIRIYRNMTQEEIELKSISMFGKDNVVTQETISRMENGFRLDPYLSTIQKICAVLKVSVSDLLNGVVPND